MCGDASYKAGRSEGSSFKGLKATGLLMSSCSHGIFVGAANMYRGEEYSFVHFMHLKAFELKSKFFVYDVICNYFPFAVNVAQSFPDKPLFVMMVTLMKKFLSRWHGITHTRSCQV